MPAAIRVEPGIVIESRLGPAGQDVVDRFLRDARIDIVSVDGEQAERAVSAWRRYGKGRHPGTYLPLRVVIRSGPGTPNLQLTADITWLRPTAQHLAELTVPIPAGYRQVPLPQAVRPILAWIPAVPLSRIFGEYVPGRALSKLKALCPAPAGLGATTRPASPSPASPALSQPVTPAGLSCAPGSDDPVRTRQMLTGRRAQRAWRGP